MSVAKCHTIALQRLGNAGGGLVAVEAMQHIPFEIQRVYYLFALAPAAIRGEHAHKELQQIYIALNGTFDVVLEDGLDSRTETLSAPDVGLYIGPNVWRRLENFTPGAICLVLASQHYDEADYWRDKTQFLADVARLREK